MYIDYKVTMWRRAFFDNADHIEEIIKELTENKTYYVFDEKLGFTESQVLYETEEEMSPEENNGESTIEIYTSGNDKLIWSNEIKK